MGLEYAQAWFLSLDDPEFDGCIVFRLADCRDKTLGGFRTLGIRNPEGLF